MFWWGYWIFRMAAALSNQSMGSLQLLGWGNDASGSLKKFGNLSLRFISRGFAVHVGFFRKGTCGSNQHVIHGSNFNASVVDPISVSPHNDVDSFHSSQAASTETALILLRHGESLWNERNLFTGCVDVALNGRGIEEAIEAGKRISYIPVDMIYTSALIRAKMTAMLAMIQQHHRKVPIIVHNESEQTKTWSRIYSEETKNLSIPVITAGQLNERMYGELQGLNKQVTAERYGKELVQEWRRSFDICPPSGESLEMCSHRAVVYFKENIEPQLQLGKHVMVAAHANSLRSIIMYLERLTSQEVINLEISTGIPLLYIYEEGKYMRRGSPVGPTEVGVYAYTKSLALYRQKLDEMLQ
ncbi:2,3-bisphosphoglycerate-dependent phosphoglycerate mutase [Quillaja saponaria]|uniref:phosphoglycerate mutase (2,3-diphosphoglycerate-dependent) n=1 Tax=Quillaja saponaria TaxID=32244 RepID=A0AAD7KTG4_QUISA|nr:2,3-bisphosphoglycerate-dependent phosphoglycerate mutase [Quillaja saponaria]